MSKLEEFKDYVAYLLSIVGITLNWGDLKALIIFLMTAIFLFYQILHKRNEKKVSDLKEEKLKLEIERLKNDTKDGEDE